MTSGLNLHSARVYLDISYLTDYKIFALKYILRHILFDDLGVLQFTTVRIWHHDDFHESQILTISHVSTVAVMH